MIKRIPIMPIFFAIVLFALAALLNRSIEKPPIVINKQDSAFNLQNSFYKFTFAGYKRLIADVLWITTLLESDTTHYKNGDLNNWMFLRFNSITTLDPKFLQNYVFATQYLSIVKDDPHGAAVIFERGINYYPNNYNLLFNGAFLYGFELREYAKATELFKR
ncbi:MAG: hypothetical protein KC478_13490, partial [Bacteriovoracaceae bacterium]|nr:hypothetical protein [Bacteriovoracaceae bacterium]